jgi:hypothetical protein
MYHLPFWNPAKSQMTLCHMISQSFSLKWVVQPFFGFGNIEQYLQMGLLKKQLCWLVLNHPDLLF